MQIILIQLGVPSLPSLLQAGLYQFLLISQIWEKPLGGRSYKGSATAFNRLKSIFYGVLKSMEFEESSIRNRIQDYDFKIGAGPGKGPVQLRCPEILALLISKQIFLLRKPIYCSLRGTQAIPFILSEFNKQLLSIYYEPRILPHAEKNTNTGEAQESTVQLGQNALIR